MKDILALQEMLHTFCQSAPDLSSLSWEQLWQRYGQGISIREQFCQVIPKLHDGQIVEYMELLTSAETKTHHIIYEQAQVHQNNLEHQVRHWTHQFEYKIRSATNNINQTPVILAAQLRGYAGEILLLKRLATRLANRPPVSILPDVFSEIHHLELQADSAPHLFQDVVIAECLHDLKEQALQKELYVFTNEIQNIKNKLDQVSLETLSDVILWGNNIQTHTPAHHPELIQQCQGHKQTVRQWIKDKLQIVTAEERHHFIQKFILELEENLQELLTSNENKLSYIVQNLEYLQDDCAWLTSCTQTIAPPLDQTTTPLSSPVMSELQNNNLSTPLQSTPEEPQETPGPESREETAQAEPQETTQAEPQETTQAEPQETTQAEPQETTQAEPLKTAQAESQETTQAEPQETTENPPQETSEAELQKATEAEQPTASQLVTEDTAEAEQQFDLKATPLFIPEGKTQSKTVPPQSTKYQQRTAKKTRMKTVKITKPSSEKESTPYADKLKKLQYSIKVELQEKQLQNRLESIFGRKFVTFFEDMILVLILLVIVLLFAEIWLRHAEYLFDLDLQHVQAFNAADIASDSPQPLPTEVRQAFEKAGYPLSEKIRISTHTHNQEWEVDDDAYKNPFIVVHKEDATSLYVHKMSIWVLILMIADGIICFIFLLECFTKLALVQGRGLYFRRHFLIDFLPSIPFGLLAAGLEHLDYTRFARALRFLRLQRILRYARVLRPIMRIVRVIVFSLRGLDRLFLRYGKPLNRNVILFSTLSELQQDRGKNLLHKIHELRGECLFYSRDTLRRFPTEQNHPFLVAYLQALEIRLAHSNGNTLLKEAEKSADNIPIESIVNTLLYIRGNEIEAWLGEEFPQLVYRYLGLLDAPCLRKLPVIRRIVAFHRQTVPAEFTAAIARMVGQCLQKVLDVIYWFSDLYGIVSGPRLIDRVGRTLINSFKDPAKKLLTIGSMFVIANLLVNALPWEILKLVVGILNRYVGLPLFLIGTVCSIPLALGWWLKNIAGEATDFYERTSEAQFINLLKEIKWSNSNQDLEILYQRVFMPELAVLGQPQEKTSVLQKLYRELQEIWNTNLAPDTRGEARLEKLYRQVLFLYRDYLDGAVFHRRDMKTTKQFLGNLTLSNIRTHRLQYNKKAFKALETLDLEKPRLFGPYIWFSLITDSISCNVAQLIIDYNRHAIPQKILHLQPETVQQEYQEWLQQRLNPDEKQTSIDDAEEREKRRKQKAPLYLTTQFTALHFLSCNTNRDENIRENFGDEVYQAFIQDRENLIKSIFGSYPLPELPAQYRVINPYHLYQQHIARGRIFILPFKLVYYIFGIVLLLIKWAYQKLREIINPMLHSSETVLPQSDLSVAFRKLNRMRKPIYIASMRLRSICDFEYLGFNLASLLNPDQESDDTHPAFEDDLELIHALDYEHDEFNTLKVQRAAQLYQWQQLIQERIWQGQTLLEYLASLGQQVEESQTEILRAITIAYTINYKNFATLLDIRKTLVTKFEEAIACQGKIVLSKKERPSLYQRLIFWRNKNKDYALRQAWQKAWQDLGYSARYGEEQQQYAQSAYHIQRHLLEDSLQLLADEGGLPAISQIISEIALNPTAWSEELVSLRTIQTLSVMDIHNYQKHIIQLSGMELVAKTPVEV